MSLTDPSHGDRTQVFVYGSALWLWSETSFVRMFAVFRFLIMSSECWFTVTRGGAQVVSMDWISVLDHKHLPSAHFQAPRPALCTVPSAWHKLQGKANTAAKTYLVVVLSRWKKVNFLYNHFGNVTSPPTRRWPNQAQRGAWTDLSSLTENWNFYHPASRCVIVPPRGKDFGSPL